jgi:hypothetical protein
VWRAVFPHHTCECSGREPWPLHYSDVQSSSTTIAHGDCVYLPDHRRSLATLCGNHRCTYALPHYGWICDHTTEHSESPTYHLVVIPEDLDKELRLNEANSDTLPHLPITIQDLICDVDVIFLRDRSKGDGISKALAFLQAG